MADMMFTMIEALSGLGVFLFGMYYLESSLKEAAGVRFKQWIKSSTSTRLRALFAGATSTAILQSSSVVTLMTLSFVSAGLMTLYSGIAVIFGSNLGTTATAWIVATVGFKVKIELFALPMIGLGGLLFVLAPHHKKIDATAKIMIGFGLLFFGLDIMKTAIESVAGSIDLSSFRDYPLYTFVALGFIITGLIQSSSAVIAIVLSALYAQILSFEAAVAMVIGTNIGTTITVILGSIGGVPDKKRAAAAHFVFNLFTAIIALSLLPFLTELLLVKFALKSDPTTALALFHTIFNLLGIIILTPFIPFFSRTLKKMFHHKKRVVTKYIHLVEPSIPDAAFVALRNEVSNLFVKSMKFGLLLANIKPGDIINKTLSIKDLTFSNQELISFDYDRAYDVLKEVEIAIVEFISDLTQKNLTPEQSDSLDVLLMSVRESVYAAKILKDVKENMDTFTQSDKHGIQNTFEDIRRNLAYVMRIFVNYINEKWDSEKCINKFEKAKDENQQILKRTSSSVGDIGVNNKTIASLLNTNRSVYIASESLMNASKATLIHYVIDDESV
jgi:phosphate:Na+ symporter